MVDYDHYKNWFYAAAFYNLIWGTLVILFPNLYFELVNMKPPTYVAIWQVVGMLVLTYSPAYWWVARNPQKFSHFVFIGYIGKIFGSIGFIWSLFTNNLPLEFGWTIITNDLIWLPVFTLYLKKAVQTDGGLRNFLSV